MLYKGYPYPIYGTIQEQVARKCCFDKITAPPVPPGQFHPIQLEFLQLSNPSILIEVYDQNDLLIDSFVDGQFIDIPGGQTQYIYDGGAPIYTPGFNYLKFIISHDNGTHERFTDFVEITNCCLHTFEWYDDCNNRLLYSTGFLNRFWVKAECEPKHRPTNIVDSVQTTFGEEIRLSQRIVSQWDFLIAFQYNYIAVVLNAIAAADNSWLYLGDGRYSEIKEVTVDEGVELNCCLYDFSMQFQTLDLLKKGGCCTTPVNPQRWIFPDVECCASCYPPSNVVITECTTDSFTFEIIPNQVQTDYEFSTNGNIWIPALPNTSITFGPPLVSCTEFTLYVRSVCDVGEFSEPFIAHVETKCNECPQGFFDRPTPGKMDVNLSWGVDFITCIWIKQTGQSDQSYILIGEFDPTVATSTVIPNLDPCTDYTVRGQQKCDFDEAPTGEYFYATFTTQCSELDFDIQITNEDCTGGTIDIVNITGAVGIPSLLICESDGTPIGPPPQTVPAGNYIAKVTDDCGEVQETVSVGEIPECQPTNMVVVEILTFDTNSIGIEWSDVGDSYNVRIKCQNEPDTSYVITPVNGTNFVFENLQCDKWYDVGVQSVICNTECEWDNQLVFVPCPECDNVPVINVECCGLECDQQPEWFLNNFFELHINGIGGGSIEVYDILQSLRSYNNTNGLAYTEQALTLFCDGIVTGNLINTIPYVSPHIEATTFGEINTTGLVTARAFVINSDDGCVFAGVLLANGPEPEDFITRSVAINRVDVALKLDVNPNAECYCATVDNSGVSSPIVTSVLEFTTDGINWNPYVDRACGAIQFRLNQTYGDGCPESFTFQDTNAPVLCQLTNPQTAVNSDGLTNTIGVFWNDVADYYNIRFKESNELQYIQFSTQNTNYTFNFLQCDLLYDIGVQAVICGQECPWENLLVSLDCPACDNQPQLVVQACCDCDMEIQLVSCSTVTPPDTVLVTIEALNCVGPSTWEIEAQPNSGAWQTMFPTQPTNQVSGQYSLVALQAIAAAGNRIRVVCDGCESIFRWQNNLAGTTIADVCNFLAIEQLTGLNENCFCAFVDSSNVNSPFIDSIQWTNDGINWNPYTPNDPVCIECNPQPPSDEAGVINVPVDVVAAITSPGVYSFTVTWTGFTSEDVSTIESLFLERGCEVFTFGLILDGFGIFTVGWEKNGMTFDIDTSGVTIVIDTNNPTFCFTQLGLDATFIPLLNTALTANGFSGNATGWAVSCLEIRGDEIRFEAVQTYQDGCPSVTMITEVNTFIDCNNFNLDTTNLSN